MATTQNNVLSNIPGIAVSVVNTAISDHCWQVGIIQGKRYAWEPTIKQLVSDTRHLNITLLTDFIYKEKWHF